MAGMGVKAYRFLISWSRIIGDGTTATVNQEGIDFYNRLIDTCIAHDIEP